MLYLQSSKTHGAIVIDGRHVADTLQCVHCGGHFQIIPGSGRKRGFCPQCNMGFVCGQKECMIHIPFEAKMEYQEATQVQNLQAIKKLISKYPLITKI